MGIYRNKLRESAVEEVIQTPDDIGVDLDAIEKNIMGDDGIEAHRDEVEAAEEGLIGDPVDEAFIIMYESEYNFNQLMKCIGITELQEAAAGRDFILEGANLEEFFKKASDAFVKMFERITEVFGNVINNLHAALANDKAFVAKHEDEIKAGYEQHNKWNVKGYDLDKLNVEYKPVATELWNIADKEINDVLGGASWSKEGNENLSHIKAVKRVSGLDVSSEDKAAGEMVDQLKASTFVNKEYGYGKANFDLNEVLNILKSDNDTKTIREAYNKIKADYKDLLKWLKDTQKKLAVNKKDEVNQAAMNVCLAYITAQRYEKNLQHSIFANCLNAHKARRAMARRLALTCQRVGAQAEKKEDQKPEEEIEEVIVDENQPKNESTFFNFNLI